MSVCSVKELDQDEKVTFDVRVVVAGGAIGDWAAYYIPINNLHDFATLTDERVAERGIKLHPEAAAQFFPYMTESKYRWP